MPELKHCASDTDPQVMAESVKADGAAILENAMFGTPPELQAIAGDLGIEMPD